MIRKAISIEKIEGGHPSNIRYLTKIRIEEENIVFVFEHRFVHEVNATQLLKIATDALCIYTALPLIHNFMKECNE